MIIQPPSDKEYTEETINVLTYDKASLIILKEYLSIRPWICPSCGLTNFGHNKKCADFRCRYKRE